MKFATAPELTHIEAPSSSEAITITLRKLRSDAQKRKNLYNAIKHLENYLASQHNPESGVDIQNVKNQVQAYWQDMNLIFEEREDDSHAVREKIEARSRLLSSVNFGGENQNNREVEARNKIMQREVEIMTERAKSFALDHNLGNFVSSEEFPYPGIGIPGGDVIDVKSVIDKSRPVALLGATTRSDVNDLIEMYNLSRLTVGSGEHACTLIYDEDGLSVAREIAKTIDTRDNESDEPQKVYEFHMKIGNLMKIDPKAVIKGSLLEAQKVDPKFTPEEI